MTTATTIPPDELAPAGVRDGFVLVPELVARTRTGPR